MAAAQACEMSATDSEIRLRIRATARGSAESKTGCPRSSLLAKGGGPPRAQIAIADRKSNRGSSEKSSLSKRSLSLTALLHQVSSPLSLRPLRLCVRQISGRENSRGGAEAAVDEESVEIRVSSVFFARVSLGNKSARPLARSNRDRVIRSFHRHVWSRGLGRLRLGWPIAREQHRRQ